MADSQEKKIGPEIHGPTTLHGKRARLMRGDTEVVGVLLSNSSQTSSDNMVFQFVDANGVKSISQVTADELDNIQDALIDY
jgi:hypothetical protein